MKNAQMNKTLAQFLSNKAKIAKMEKENEKIKAELQAKGSFETDEFTVDVSPVTTNRTISADELCVVLDPVLVAEKNLIRTSTYDKVTVKKISAKSKAA